MRWLEAWLSAVGVAAILDLFLLGAFGVWWRERRRRRRLTQAERHGVVSEPSDDQPSAGPGGNQC